MSTIDRLADIKARTETYHEALCAPYSNAALEAQRSTEPRNPDIRWLVAQVEALTVERDRLAAEQRYIAELLGEDPDDVPEGQQLVDHMALRVGYLRGRDVGFEDVEAERDAFAAKVARVEALVDEMSRRYAAARRARRPRERSLIVGLVLDAHGAADTWQRAESDLRAALADPDGGDR